MTCFDYASVSIAQLLKEAVAHLAFSESPRLDAEVLLAHVLNRPRRFFYTYPEFILQSEQIAAFAVLCQRRMAGEPVAYIIGTREFWSLSLKVSPATLIPRPDTERLVELVLETYGHHTALRVLDLGTGTGAIALALATECPTWRVEGVDVVAQAVQLAQENAQCLKVSNVNFRASSWFSAFTDADKGGFNLIVSNPPYIAEDDEHLGCGDVRFEPQSALVAPCNGLADIETIIAEAKKYLVKNGALFLEHGWQQAHAVRDVFVRHGYSAIETWQDYGGNDRVTCGRWVGDSR